MMNPETNEFEALKRNALEELVREDGSPVPDGWPVFQLNEKIEMKGYIFKVEKIRRRRIVLSAVGRAEG